MHKRLALLLSLCLVVLLVVTACGKKEQKEKVTSWTSAPAMSIDTGKTYQAEFDTSKGKFKVDLFAKDAPKTVNNFVFLAKQGFYDGLTFHRIIKTFMIQGGDPQGNGAGGPGYTIEDEKPKYKYDPGIVAMARTKAPNSAGSQFFICTGDDCGRSLNPNPVYAIFGKVSEGMDVVQKIAATPVKLNQDSGEVAMPTEKVTINKITIKEK